MERKDKTMPKTSWSNKLGHSPFWTTTEFKFHNYNIISWCLLEQHCPIHKIAYFKFSIFGFHFVTSPLALLHCSPLHFSIGWDKKLQLFNFGCKKRAVLKSRAAYHILAVHSALLALSFLEVGFHCKCGIGKKLLLLFFIVLLKDGLVKENLNFFL